MEMVNHAAAVLHARVVEILVKRTLLLNRWGSSDGRCITHCWWILFKINIHRSLFLSSNQVWGAVIMLISRSSVPSTM